MRRKDFNSKGKVIYINRYVEFKESYVNSIKRKILVCKEEIEKIFYEILKDNPLGAVIRWKNTN